MSGQWEVVGKKKVKGNKNEPQKQGKEVKKKINLDISISDILPKSQVKNLYNEDKVSKESKKPQEKVKVQDNGKKTQKKPEKSQEPPKIKPPKNIESALKTIDIEEFKAIFEKSQTYFPDAPIVWLKELTQFLNIKIPVEVPDPVFSAKAEGYPLNIVPVPLKSLIEKALKEAGNSNVQVFFDITLTSLATDMSKGLPGVGHKLFLQTIALSNPSLVLTGMKKHVVLRNSYQNRPNIGLSMLWAIGQAGLTDFQTGFTVFRELMHPLIELKNYSKFIVKYLIDIISKDNGAAVVSKEDFLLIVDVLYPSKRSFPSELKDNLVVLSPKLKGLLFSENKSEKYHTLVECMLTNLNSNPSKAYQKLLCDIIIECFQRDETSITHWSKIYSKNIAGSAILLQYIAAHWVTIYRTLSAKIFNEALRSLTLVNNNFPIQKRKDGDILNSTIAMEKISNRISQQAKQISSFPCKTFAFFTILILASIVYTDISTNGSWKDSTTLFALKNSGVYDYSNQVLNKSLDSVHWVNLHIQKRFPGYDEKVVEIATPYVGLLKNLGLVTYNWGKNVKDSVIGSLPAVANTIEAYAPGLLEQSRDTAKSVWSTTIVYVNQVVKYLRTEVFIGQLSPENMQRVVWTALNTTQHKAAECYHWIYQKVQTTIK